MHFSRIEATWYRLSGQLCLFQVYQCIFKSEMKSNKYRNNSRVNLFYSLLLVVKLVLQT